VQNPHNFILILLFILMPAVKKLPFYIGMLSNYLENIILPALVLK